MHGGAEEQPTQHLVGQRNGQEVGDANGYTARTRVVRVVEAQVVLQSPARMRLALRVLRQDLVAPLARDDHIYV